MPACCDHPRLAPVNIAVDRFLPADARTRVANPQSHAPPLFGLHVAVELRESLGRRSPVGRKPAGIRAQRSRAPGNCARRPRENRRRHREGKSDPGGSRDRTRPNSGSVPFRKGWLPSMCRPGCRRRNSYRQIPEHSRCRIIGRRAGGVGHEARFGGRQAEAMIDWNRARTMVCLMVR